MKSTRHTLIKAAVFGMASLMMKEGWDEIDAAKKAWSLWERVEDFGTEILTFYDAENGFDADETIPAFEGL